MVIATLQGLNMTFNNNANDCPGIKRLKSSRNETNPDQDTETCRVFYHFVCYCLSQWWDFKSSLYIDVKEFTIIFCHMLKTIMHLEMKIIMLLCVTLYHSGEILVSLSIYWCKGNYYFFWSYVKNNNAFRNENYNRLLVNYFRIFKRVVGVFL